MCVESQECHSPDLFEVEHRKTELPVQPWQLNPYALVSWLEMLKFSARAFFWAGVQLQQITAECLLKSSILDGDTPIYAMYRPLDDETRTGAVVLLKNVDSHCRMLGMNITADTAKELLARLESPATATHNYQWLRDQVDGIRKLIDKEMTGKVFLYISPERAQYFTNQARPHLFGTDVANAFPSTRYDIYEAGVCAATGRGAATVFHLMRTLEIALTVLAAKFGVSMAHTNWAPAIEEIESKIREMHKDSQWKSLPDCKSQQEQLCSSC